MALDRTWRAAWPAADAAARAVIRAQVALYDMLWDALYLLLLLGFLSGNVGLALATRALATRGTAAGAQPDGGLAAWVSAAFWAAAGLTLLFLLPEFGGPAVPGTTWLYPLIQPAGRALVGVWLWPAAAPRAGRDGTRVDPAPRAGRMLHT